MRRPRDTREAHFFATEMMKSENIKESLAVNEIHSWSRWQFDVIGHNFICIL